MSRTAQIVTHASAARTSAAGYFHELSQLLLGTQITNRRGEALSLDEGTAAAAALILAVRSASGKVMLVGNGGSAAIASHMHNDLSKAVGVRASVFNEPPLLTALSNDHGYASVFERPIELWADAGDLLVAFSSSGRSENILRAVRAATVRGCRAVTFSGFRPTNPLRHTGDVNFYVPSEAYGYVEVAHGALAHFLTDCCSAKRSEAASAQL